MVKVRLASGKSGWEKSGRDWLGFDRLGREWLGLDRSGRDESGRDLPESE